MVSDVNELIVNNWTLRSWKGKLARAITSVAVIVLMTAIILGPLVEFLILICGFLTVMIFLAIAIWIIENWND